MATRAVLEPGTENELSAKRARYVLVGSPKAIDTFCDSKFGKKLDDLPNVRGVSRYHDLAAIRQDPSWRQRDTAYRAPILMFLPGWSRVHGMLSEALLYELAALDERR